MKFIKYPNIINVYQQASIDYTYKEGLNVGAWVVQEKIHGCNLSFWVDTSGDVRVAKRSGFIAPDENFYKADEALKAHTEPLQRLFKIISELTSSPEKSSNLDFVAVYGEMFGGYYSHPDVPKVTGHMAVQKGVMYSPFVHFAAFDVLIGFQDGRLHYLDTDRAERVLREVGIRPSRTLFVGTMEAALQYQNDFQSRLPGQLGLPSPENNVCEGVVIKPQETRFFANGKRVIFKNKNDKYKERDASPKKRTALIESLPPETRRICGELASYVTENRLLNVLSKMGPFDFQKIGMYIHLLVKDAFEEAFLDTDLQKRYSELDRATQNVINKSLDKLSSKIVKDYMRSNRASN
jgi:Rnl2 family RNA ligase